MEVPIRKFFCSLAPILLFALFFKVASAIDEEQKLHYNFGHRIVINSHYGWNGNTNAYSEQIKQVPLQRYNFAQDPERARLHPLDPLTESEITSTSAVIRNFRNADWMFNYIALKEPEKSVLLPYFLSNTVPRPLSIPRKSFSLILDRSTNQAYEVVVNLDRRLVESWTASPSNVQAPFTPQEMLDAERVVREDRQVQERCRRLGWNDMRLVFADPWSMGYIGDRPEYQGLRLMQMYLYGKNFEGDNQYVHPFDFLAVVDLLAKRVIAIEDLPTHDDFDANDKVGNIVPNATSNYDPQLRSPNSYRRDLRPLKISQPQGASYTVAGNEIQWQKFKMRVGFNGREGLVIYQVSYNDDGKVRPLFYRMSLSEMWIPYGDPRPPYHRKAVYDMGQYGIGFNANELQPQLDCLGTVHFFDGVLHNEAGEPQRIPRAVCLHEEDAGILWKHTDYRTGNSHLTRSQRLALTFIVTVGNYDYIYSWHFYQDATIEYNVKLTGILSTNLLAVNATPTDHESLVFPQVVAQYHQHFFSVRLDAEIDGNANSVVVSDAVPVVEPTGSRQNPYGQGFTTRKTLLKTASSARSNILPEASRTWHITNPNSLNPFTKQPVSWKLMPWASPPTMVKQNSPLHPQAEWLDYSTWVLPYQEDRIFPGGFYLNNSGLPEWVEQDRNAVVDNTDIVIWHNFGITHIPRTEDAPIMPVETCGIILKPMNFFKENPSIDVPAPKMKDEL